MKSTATRGARTGGLGILRGSFGFSLADARRNLAHALVPLDLVEIEAAIRECYAMISGPAGPRDWSRQDAIFHPDCRQMRTGVDADGMPWMETFTPEEYRANADALLSRMDFYEVELVNRIEVFGNMAQAWSSYEA
ncbi:MAG: hypothetical protein JKY97_01700, partial [Citromicrobium sp.]|nr:hypothetical protein [Citromicrobium sp.]